LRHPEVALFQFANFYALLENEMSGNQLTRYEEACAFTSSVKDENLRAALEYALSTVLTRRRMDPEVTPSPDFDLRFFIEIVRAMFDNNTVMKMLVEGKAHLLRW
jgi:hypothetical protein